VPYPLYIGPAALALLVSLRLGWTWALLSLGALVLLGTVVMGLPMSQEPVLLPSDTAKTPVVRLMTYNIKSYRANTNDEGYTLLAEEIAQHEPDVLVMQDARDLPLRGLPPEMKAVLKEHKHQYGFGQYMVVSRHPLRGCAPGDISFRSRKSTYVHCVLQVNGSEADLVVAHFITPREGLNAARNEQLAGIDDWKQNFADRMEQSTRLAADLVRVDRPVIVAGDLNAPEHSPVVRQLLDTGLRDAFSTAGEGYGYSVGHALRPHVSLLRIDHILVTPLIGVARCVTGGKEASEHRPVIADLVLPPAAPTTGKVSDKKKG
jgi:endonuclease/exonuclease/phosphatase (EEP) superfamily protein YafD